jgi:trimethyllysine dioxygenase
MKNVSVEDRLPTEFMSWCAEQFRAAPSMRDDIIDLRNDEQSVVYSSAQLPPHTDGSFSDEPPFVVTMGCIVADEGDGGTSILIDGYKIIQHLSAEERKILATEDFHFRAPSSEDDGLQTSILSMVNEWPAIRYRYDSKYKPKSSSTAAINALEELHTLVSNVENAKMVKLTPGDVLVVNNYRILHGRTALTRTVRRQLRRFTFTGPV